MIKKPAYYHGKFRMKVLVFILRLTYFMNVLLMIVIMTLKHRKKQTGSRKGFFIQFLK